MEVSITDPPYDPLEATAAAPAARVRVRDLAGTLIRLASLATALFLFVLAIQLMKDGAAAMAPTIHGSRLFANGFSTLGAGWLGAYVVLSGSPIAAVSLGLFAGGALTKLQTFTMLSGSRLGASFVVLLVGFLYAIRNPARSRSESVGMGIQALGLTAVVYLPGMLVGYAFLKTGMLDGIRWSASNDALSLIDVVWGPVLHLLQDHLPGWLLLLLGLAAILVSFKLLDRVLPTLDGERAASRRERWLKRTWPMFLLGCAVASLTLSVSVALTVLVPLASRGYVKREEAIPYIMGANITTLADTLVAAMLTGDPVAVHIVLAEALGVSLVTVAYLAVLYAPLKRAIVGMVDWVIGSNRRLWAFVATIFLMPLLLMLSGALLGPLGS
ncbi:MAG: hypothetical protein ACE14W_02675 [Candidatus Velamenicoccus archaeovorus]